jgi:hypothetical protein
MTAFMLAFPLMTFRASEMLCGWQCGLVGSGSGGGGSELRCSGPL